MTTPAMQRDDLPVYGPANARVKACADCGCRKDSPLRSFYEPRDLAEDGEPFYCHQGAAFDEFGEFRWDLYPEGAPPPKADGTPADLCAGWLAYRKAALRGIEL